MTQLFARHIVIEDVMQTIDRQLPAEGKILVKKGQEVNLETVIGEYFRVSGFRNYDLVKLLGIKSEDAKECLLRSIGSQVYAGTLLVRQKQLLGLKTVELISPIEGELHSISEGVLTIKQAPERRRVVAGVQGLVEGVLAGRGVRIKTRISSIYGALSAGNDREGVVKVISNRDIALAARSITNDCQGKIVVGGALLTKEVIHKSLSIGVRGIVSGGIHWSDFGELITSARGKTEDVGITIFITEGFGFQPMSQKAFDFFSRYQKHFGMILTSPNCLIIPLPPVKGEKDISASKNELSYAPLEKGKEVRVIVPPRLDGFGTIVESQEMEGETEAGVKGQGTRVNLEGKKKWLPSRNLEIIVNN